MNVNPFEMKESVSQMSDEELLRVVSVDAGQYRPEALALAKAEMARRGLATDNQVNRIKCVKCAGVMEEGFVPDFGHYEYVRPLKWIEGKPEKTFWKGTKVEDRRDANISAYRCRECGYVELYAKEESRP
jgi:hypothetical protein